ncbi:SGNH/GDSL hydrolase family protein [Arthrobacter sp. AL08]|uniref:SGNH/GDSL hydrolase family protein n=1 Tax=Micrococcaceae TaxID=1268 RepID=UPI002499E601|nr:MULTISPECIES: SGNH/GDSL hydrolase family protein [Micrococcaceae]MDI3241374.1 SGNH/GDSL hydrolase family protein [Arthrobacter sp. AL05]MDI3277369.1 SGNH/GDSL hydrolase family protein [Arthrobacter sp. AL08]MDJ0354032.1 SGNH/GDSL hydrolase family protein [Pseudarthrobacter sp. PH31-O2]
MSSQSWIITPITADIVRGALELEHTERGTLFHRLPSWARAQSTDPQLRMVESQPSGVRLVFRSCATAIELDVHRTRTTYAGFPQRPDGIIELMIDGNLTAHITTSGGTTSTIDMATGATAQITDPMLTVRFAELPGHAKVIEIWLPHNENLEILQLRTDAPLEPGSVRHRPVWLHHGSSISQGSNATRPSEIWPVRAARLSDVELINLGFGGSALLDPFMARTMRETDADLISVKIGINLVNNDLMRLRAFGPAVHGFLDTIREGHPDTPLLVISPIYCAIHEDTPGPGAFDMDALAEGTITFRAAGAPAERAAGKLTLTTIRESLSTIVEQRQKQDPHLFYLDGLELFGSTDAQEFPLPDALHPSPAAHRLISERFTQMAFENNQPFGTPTRQKPRH